MTDVFLRVHRNSNTTLYLHSSSPNAIPHHHNTTPTSAISRTVPIYSMTIPAFSRSFPEFSLANALPCVTILPPSSTTLSTCHEAWSSAESAGRDLCFLLHPVLCVEPFIPDVSNFKAFLLLGPHTHSHTLTHTHRIYLHM